MPSGGDDMILAPVRAPDAHLGVGVPYCGTTGSGPKSPRLPSPSSYVGAGRLDRTTVLKALADASRPGAGVQENCLEHHGQPVDRRAEVAMPRTKVRARPTQ
jgi:hypothetical protein